MRRSRWTSSMMVFVASLPAIATVHGAPLTPRDPSMTRPALLPPAVAMAGKECVAIGSDLRFGVQLQTLATDYKKIYKVHDQLFIGLAGLGTDAQTL